MIPNISKNGRSFKGAALYHFHDKDPDRDTPNDLKPTTDDRVAFIATRNLAFDDPDRAVSEMIATAYAQNELKREAGLSTAGRKCTEPVKTISLSWHPDEKPTYDHMIEAADRYLKHMKWDEHQAVYIGHKDTEHPHIHILLNRIHPETGLVLNDRLDYKRSQEWALEYEKEMGRIWCEKRLDYEKPREERAPAANDNLPHNVIELARPAQAEYAASEKTRAEEFALERDLLKREQRLEREAWFDEGKDLFKRTRNAIWREVKEEYRPDWKQHFADQADRLEDAEQNSSSAVARAFQFAKTGDWEQARAAFNDRDILMKAVTAEFGERGAELRKAQLEETRERQGLALDALKQERVASYKDLLDRQQDQRQEMRDAHTSGERASHLLGQTQAARSANENVASDVRVPTTANTKPEPDIAAARVGVAIDAPLPDVPGLQAPVVEPLVALNPTLTPDDRVSAHMVDNAVTGGADLAAGSIGVLADYLTDQMGEMFAPTPPEVREAQAKALEKARAEAPAPEPVNPYLKYAGVADNKAQLDREDKERDDYWDDKERRRER
jgi:hypothetical protein